MAQDSSRSPRHDGGVLSRIAGSNGELDDITGLVVQPPEEQENDAFTHQLRRTLEETTRELLDFEVTDEVDAVESWGEVKRLVEDFRPVPSFIWRLSHFVLGRPGVISPIGDGLVFGLRRLLFAVASDPLLSGTGGKVNDVRKAISAVGSDCIAAAAVIHAVCRRLSSHEHERIWRPLLDDALRRAQLGACVGRYLPEFGVGRGMLAGFAGRIGVVIQIATGSLEQAKRALELLATGEDISVVGLRIYRAEPLQVSAMILSAAGCGREAAMGTASYASQKSKSVQARPEEHRWLSAFTIIEHLRMETPDQIADVHWDAFGLEDEGSREVLIKQTRDIIRRGHRWEWLI